MKSSGAAACSSAGQRGRSSWPASCRGGDPDRAPRFRRALERLGAEGAMGDLDDGPEQKPLPADQVRALILALLPGRSYDLILTHSPRANTPSTGATKRRPEAVHSLCEDGALTTRGALEFAYEDGGGTSLPRARPEAPIRLALAESLWAEKRRLMRDSTTTRRPAGKPGRRPGPKPSNASPAPAAPAGNHAGRPPVMKILVLYDYPPAPGGLATQGDLLYHGLLEIGVDAKAAHLRSDLEKEWHYRWFKPDAVVGVGFWGDYPDIVQHPQRFGMAAVPWLLADGYVANYRRGTGRAAADPGDRRLGQGDLRPGRHPRRPHGGPARGLRHGRLHPPGPRTTPRCGPCAKPWGSARTSC